MTVSPPLVANNLLDRSFHDGTPLTPMRLQRLLYLTACAYARYTGDPLLSEPFETWRTGPVSRAAYDKFRPFATRPITRYAPDATGHAWRVDETASPAVRRAMNLVWSLTADLTGVELNRLVTASGTAWRRTAETGGPVIPFDLMAADRALDLLTGVDA